jgi:hypothetical protein
MVRVACRAIVREVCRVDRWLWSEIMRGVAFPRVNRAGPAHAKAAFIPGTGTGAGGQVAADEPSDP